MCGIGYLILQLAVISEQNQAFTVEIQPAGGIYIRDINILCQSRAFGFIPFPKVGKLAEHTKRLVKQDKQSLKNGCWSEW